MVPSLMGVYVIENTETGRAYVGASVNVFQRLREHISGLNKGQHPTTDLQADWGRLGPCAFAFRAVELVADRSLKDPTRHPPRAGGHDGGRSGWATQVTSS
jgi:hypothetical protein